MMPRWLTRVVRRAITSPQVYGALRSSMLIIQRLARLPDEPDLRFLARIPARGNELILDVGANGGQSAIALSFLRPRAKIISYEPVLQLWPELERIGKVLGPRFELRKYALGRSPGLFSLHIPICGKLAITTRASIWEEVAVNSCRELERSIGLPTKIQLIEVEVRQGDDEQLAPMAIKIDVEGAEYEVVRGFAATIRASRPVVILERSDSFDDCRRFFRTIDYDILTHEGAFADGIRLPGLSHRNWIACPTETTRHLLGSLNGSG